MNSGNLVTKVLVTGAGGFVGNILCRDLIDQRYEVVAMDNHHKLQCDGLLDLVTNDNFTFVPGDVTDYTSVKKAMEGCDAVIHLAALVGFPACLRQPTLAQVVNVEGTKNVVNAAEGRRVVFASTGSVYGVVEDVCTEDSPLNAVSLYGTSKLEAEQYVSSHENTVSFRFATGFGVSPNMRVNLLVNDLVYQCVTNGAINIFQPDARRTFIHVTDMSRAFIYGLDGSKLNHKVYNCGDNDLNWTKRELAEHIALRTNAFVSYNESGEDADKRDYEVSYDLLANDGFRCEKTMEQGIDELIKAVPLMNITHQYM